MSTGADLGKGATIGATAGSVVPGVGTAIGASAGTLAAGLYGIGKTLGIGGGKDESQADLDKQDIQQKLAQMGYSFSKMSGWKGDEKRKRDAMQTILQAVQANPKNARIAETYMEGGKITPNTISQLRARALPPEKTTTKTGVSYSANASEPAPVPEQTQAAGPGTQRNWAKFGIAGAVIVVIITLLAQ